MKLKYLKIGLVVWMSLSVIGVRAQNIDTSVFQQRVDDSAIVHLALKAKPTAKGILLRWAPSKAGGWVLLNKTGYQLQRRELTDAGATDWVDLSPRPIHPRPVEDWATFAKDTANAYPLIAAQAIYGKKFGNQPGVGLADKADELSNRYSFTLLSSDLSFETAEYAGLGFLDATAVKEKTYAYRIFAATPLKNYFPADTGTLALQYIEPEMQPVPYLNNPEEGELAVTLSWDKAFHKNFFTAYYIERSKDGRHFERLTRKPYLQFDNPALAEDKNQFTYTDSLTRNYEVYSYRILGIDAFGQMSAPGNIVTGMGRDKTPPPSAKDVKGKIMADGSVEITWQAERSADLKGFLIGRSAENSLSGFERIHESELSVTTRKFTDKNPRTDAPNYYVVLSVDTAGNASISMPVHVGFIDSMPPSSPKGLAGKIDTAGVLRLSWKPNPEKDVKGYIVFYANDSTHFFTAASREALPDSFYIDTLSLRTLTEDIYFKVKAVDFNNNTSEASEVVKVQKPDIIPPVAPQFSDFQVKDKAVALQWIPSSSDDVVRHEIYRRKSEQDKWELINTVAMSETANAFTDTTFSANTKYQYKIQSVDDAGLRSPESGILRIKTLDNLVGEVAKKFDAVLDTKAGNVRVSWDFSDKDVERCVVYRAVNGGSFQTQQVVSAPGKQYVDSKIQSGNTYEYTCKLFYKSGKVAPFSVIKKIVVQ